MLQTGFVIDTTFIFENVHSGFLGAGLYTKNGCDNTFVFGFLRDLLRIRQALGINNGIAAIGEDAYSVTSKEDIERTLLVLRKMELPFVHKPNQTILDICATFRSSASYIVTGNEKLLQLATDRMHIIFSSNSRDYDVMTPEKIRSKIGVNPEYIPTYLALTKGGERSFRLTKRQAVRSIELYGDLDGIYKHLSAFSSTVARKKLTLGMDTFFSNDSRNKISTARPSIFVDFSDFVWDLENHRVEALLRSYGFYSLIRLLEPPPAGSLADYASTGKNESISYNAVLDSEGLITLEALISSSKLCAIDTETDDKDPHQATLFGVSFSVKKGEAFFVPLIENDLEGITPEDVISSLKRIAKATDFIGHNIKYDYLVLRKHGIKIGSVHFDTMLAAYECYGDWDFFNLKYLTERLIRKTIKSYKDIVKKEQTFLDLPFKELVRHGCEDADVTLRLYETLKAELKKRGITEQYYNETLSLAEKLGETEYRGISVNSDKLNKIRDGLVNEVVNLKKAIYDKAGTSFEIDSQKELKVFLKETLSLGKYVSSNTMTSSSLERLAINRPVVRLIVEYKRGQKEIRSIDSIAATIIKDRVYPTFNQLKSAWGQLTSKKPNLFGLERIPNLKECFGKTVRHHFKDAKRSLDILCDLTKDVNLECDRVGKMGKNNFMISHPLMGNLDQDELLLSIVIGYSDAKLSQRFMIEYLTHSSIKHDLRKRYSILFHWIDEFRLYTTKQGYAQMGHIRRYFDGLKSSNIGKRKRALEYAVRWLIKY